MFAKLDTRSRRRRILSPAFLVASVGAHGLLVGGVLLASGGPPARPHVVEISIPEYVPEAVAPRPVPPPPTPPEPIAPTVESAPPEPGDFVNPVPPDSIPAELPRYSVADTPLAPDDVRGIGAPGDVIGTPVPGGDRTPTGAASPARGAGAPHEVDAVEVRPVLRNGVEMQRVLQRLYPDLLREAGVAGQSRLRLVVDAEGRVEPGSVTVVSTTHEAFTEPSLKAAGKFRFTPAKVGGRAVRVVIVMPIAWQLDRD